MKLAIVILEDEREVRDAVEREEEPVAGGTDRGDDEPPAPGAGGSPPGRKRRRQPAWRRCGDRSSRAGQRSCRPIRPATRWPWPTRRPPERVLLR